MTIVGEKLHTLIWEHFSKDDIIFFKIFLSVTYQLEFEVIWCARLQIV